MESAGAFHPHGQAGPETHPAGPEKNYIAIVIDPIYKIITGDENSADQMAKFCNQFDKVCTELGCAVIYCHHHSKGSQGAKRAIDRASGSGVFARDPDALLDLIELPVSEDLRKQEINSAAGRACRWSLQAAGKLGSVSQDDLYSETAALRACESVLGPEEYRDTLKTVEAAKKAAEARTAWRIEGTLREFPKFPPVNVWFDYPIHREEWTGVLDDIDPEEEAPGWTRRKKPPAPPRDRQQERLNALETAFAACDLDGTGKVTMKALMEYTEKSRNTIKDLVDMNPDFERDNGMVIRVSRVENDSN